jgi:hypothetical protein
MLSVWPHPQINPSAPLPYLDIEAWPLLELKGPDMVAHIIILATWEAESWEHYSLKPAQAESY